MSRLKTISLAKNKIEATRSQWSEAENRWRLLLQARREISRNYTSLTDRQNGLLFQLDTNSKKIIGEPILAIADRNGSLFSSYPYHGTVLNIRKESGEYILRCLFYPSQHEEWNGEKIEDLRLYQIEQVREVFLPDPNKLKELRLNSVLHTYNQARNSNVTNIKSQINGYKQNIVSYKRDLDSYKRRLKESETQLQSMIKPDLTLEDLKKILNQFSKNNKISNAYMNSACKMIVETNMLYTTDRKTGIENKNQPLGRFVFFLDNNGMDYSMVENLDFCSHKEESSTHYQHPNIMARKVCTGDNYNIMQAMVREGNFYELADFLILFISLFPQDGGHPFYTHGIWLSHKILEPKSNPWATSDKLWELSSHSKPRIIKKKKTVAKKKAVEPTIEESKPIEDFLRDTIAQLDHDNVPF